MLIAQDQPHIERFTRQTNGDWLFHEEKEPTARFELRSLGISVMVAELYRNVAFEAAKQQEHPSAD